MTRTRPPSLRVAPTRRPRRLAVAVATALSLIVSALAAGIAPLASAPGEAGLAGLWCGAKGATAAARDGLAALVETGALAADAENAPTQPAHGDGCGLCPACVHMAPPVAPTAALAVDSAAAPGAAPRAAASSRRGRDRPWAAARRRRPTVNQTV